MQLSIFFEHILQAKEQSGKDIPQLLDYVKNLGICGLETNAGFISQEKDLQELIKAKGFFFNQLYDFYDWKDFSDDSKMIRHVNTALQTGAKKILFVPPYFSKTVSQEAVSDETISNETISNETISNETISNETISEEIKKVILMMKKLTKLAGQNGITVTLEDFDNVLSPCAKTNRLLTFLNEVPDLKITFDTGNFITNGENLLESYELLKNAIENVHCKDRNEHFASVATGTGTLPMKQIFTQILKDGYKGNFTIEHFDVENQVESIKKSAEFFKL